MPTNTLPSSKLLAFILFLSGAVVMVYELVGTRVVAPYLGTSTYIWTSIIGVVLASLSLGYWYGGRWADTGAFLHKLAPVFATAAIFVGVTAWTSDAVQYLVQTWSVTTEIKATFVATVLFGPAAFFLGLVSPYIGRLQVVDLGSAGQQIGRVSAFSTLGSIAGTFVAGFVLIPLFGTERLLLFLAGVLVLLSGLTGWQKKRLQPAFIACFVLLLVSFLREQRPVQALADIDTPYSRVQVVDTVQATTGRPIRLLNTGPGGHQSGMFLDGDDLLFPYTKLMLSFQAVVARPARILVLGGAGYSLPKYLLQTQPQADITVVEIDQGMTKIAEEHFRLQPSPKLTIVHEDGRTYLNKGNASFDVLLLDVYSSAHYVPFQLVTKEAFEAMDTALSKKGVLVANIIGTVQGEQSGLTVATIQTMQTVFPHTRILLSYPDQPSFLQNIIVIASQTPIPEDTLHALHFSQHVYEQGLLGGFVFTDDYAPTDSLSRTQWGE